MKIVTVSLRNQKVSPRKGQLVMALIRNMKVEKALQQLAFADQKSAQFAQSLLKSAISAAKDKDYAAEDLIVSESICQEGPRYKRFFIRARGRSTSYHKRLSHFKISVSKIEKAEEKSSKTESENGKPTKNKTVNKETKKVSSNGTKS